MGMGRDNFIQSPASNRKPIIMTAKMVFSCLSKFSHPFETRSLSLDINRPVKIGRTGPNVSASTTNGIFECLVISRDHARIWYRDGNFFLQDTKSSNGTYINNELIGEKTKESAAKQVFTGDIIQFGTAVFCPDSKSRLGAIVGVVRLFLPDGSEVGSRPMAVETPTVPSAHLYQLASYIQEASHSEQKLRKKLSILQHIVETTSKATLDGWKSMVSEDFLISKIDLLQRQLEMIVKDLPENDLRNEIAGYNQKQLISQEKSKQFIEQVLHEKTVAVEKYEQLQTFQANLESECVYYKNVCQQSQEDIRDLGQEYASYLSKCEALNHGKENEGSLLEKFKGLQQDAINMKDYIHVLLSEKEILQKCFTAQQQEISMSKQCTSKSDVQNLPGSRNGLTETNIADISKSKFRVTLVNANVESIDVSAHEILPCESSIKRAPETQSQIEQLCKSFSSIEEAEIFRIERLHNIKCQLEELKTKEASGVNTPNDMQEYIDFIQLELSVLQLSDTTVALITGGERSVNDSLQILQAENYKLATQLNDTETKLQSLQTNLDQHQIDLKSLNLNSIKVENEKEHLKQQLQDVHVDIYGKNTKFIEMADESKLLEKSLEDYVQQISVLKAKLHEDKIKYNTFLAATNQLKQELAKVQENLKNSQEECKKLKATVAKMDLKISMQHDLRNDESKCPGFHVLHGMCKALRSENETLLKSCTLCMENQGTLSTTQGDFTWLEQKLTLQMLLIEDIQLKLFETEQERSMNDDLLQELMESKDTCLKLQKDNEQLVTNIAKLQSRNDRAMFYYLPVLVAVVVLMAIILYPNALGVRSSTYGSILYDKG